MGVVGEFRAQQPEGLSGGSVGNGVFVTKREVLMLRRLMGGGSNRLFTSPLSPRFQTKIWRSLAEHTP